MAQWGLKTFICLQNPMTDIAPTPSKTQQAQTQPLQTLLHHLGTHSHLQSLVAALPRAVPVEQLRQSHSGDPYHVNPDNQGLTLTLQCINPAAAPEELTWGLHGFTLDAATWDGGWPAGLNPHEATASDVLAVFAPNPDEVANMHPMLCFAIDGPAGQAFSVMALFEAAGKRLSSLGFLRVGDWRALQA